MITQQDIYDFITNQSNYTSEEVTSMIHELMQTQNCHKDVFLTPLDNGFSLPINLVCYARHDVAFNCLKKIIDFNINWYELCDNESYIDICVREDNIHILKFLLEYTTWKEDISSYHINHNTPILFYAVEHNAIECLKYLIEELHLDIHCTMNYEANIFTMACLNGSLECVKYLIEKTDVDYSYDFGTGHHAIFSAISSGNPVLVQYLVESNLYDLNATNQFGINLFRHLLEDKEGKNSFDYLFPFFKNNLNIDFLDENGEHYFFSLLQHNNHNNLFSLIQNIDIDLTHITSSYDGQDLLMRASFSGEVNFIEYLIEEKKLNPRNDVHQNGHFNVLINAVSGSNEQLVQYYLEKGYHLDQVTFQECFNILNQQEKMLKEYNLDAYFAYKNEDIINQLNKYYLIIQEKEQLEYIFIDNKNINLKKKRMKV